MQRINTIQEMEKSTHKLIFR